MRQWFAEIHRQHAAPAYERFATEIVKPGDRIITFNYDVSLDSRLCQSGKWCLGDGYGFPVEGLPCGSVVSILKLHGSINWLALLFRELSVRLRSVSVAEKKGTKMAAKRLPANGSRSE